MGGKGRNRVLAVHAEDPVLSVVAPLGLAVAVGTALFIDLRGDLQLSTDRTLSDISEEGPLLEELSPGRRGVALIGRGPMPLGDVVALVNRLADRWPAVVLRLGPDPWDGPTVPVRALYPGLLAHGGREPAVWQPLAGGPFVPGPGPVLPRLSGRLVRLLLSGRQPRANRWVRAWQEVWELAWA